jgi:hypothetical protein
MAMRPSAWITVLASVLTAMPAAAQLATPSKPFLERTGFLLESAGFRARFANDDASRKALRALPPHKFVVHNEGGDARYIYADPGHCNCIFSGTRANWQAYRDMLSNPLAPVDDVAPDYKTQASALLANDPVRLESLDEPAILDGMLMDFR